MVSRVIVTSAADASQAEEVVVRARNTPNVDGSEPKILRPGDIETFDLHDGSTLEISARPRTDQEKAPKPKEPTAEETALRQSRVAGSGAPASRTEPERKAPEPRKPGA